MPCITVRRPTGLAVLFRFRQDGVRIGRDPGNDLVVRDPSVSRQHAEIRRDGNGWVLTDLGSANGTALGGKRIEGPQRLSPGDEIRIGDTLLFFEASEAEGLPEERRRLTQRHPVVEPDPGATEPRMVGDSAPVRHLLSQVEKVAPSPATVLITGESGTGKELVARLIHRHSPRADDPFVAVNCPALPGSLLEAELFGIEARVATDVAPRPGRFEAAAGGTLLLDEVGDMEPAAQAKVLRVLEERILERIGGREPIPLDARILATTNHDLQSDMKRGVFRRDLYHRLSMVRIHVPPLRERREDIPLLVRHFLAGAGYTRIEVSPEALEFLEGYDYPGNVRELKHLVQGALLFAAGPVLHLDEIREAAHMGSRSAGEPERPGEPGDVTLVSRRLFRSIVEEGASFWTEVREPFLRRRLSADEARAVIRLAHEQTGGSYKEMARLFRVEGEYKKFVNFLRHHRLRVGD